jgi:hypothetical protein
VSWRLLSRGEVVAGLGPESPRADPNLRSWPMRPTANFERIRATVEADLAMQREVLSKPFQPIPESVTSVTDPAKRAQAVQAWLQADPAARRRREIHEEVRALGLAIVDDAGAPLEAWMISIAQLPPGQFESWMRPDFERAGFRGDPPFFTVVASLEAPETLGGVPGA